MKKYYFHLLVVISASLTSASAQTIFWTENFNNGCTSLCTSYSGTNGAWTFLNNGPATACGGATTPNLWYISCAENGSTAGTCGGTCTNNNATLHVGNDPNSPSAAAFCPTGDCGAAYDAGGFCGLLSMPPSTITDIMAQSPVINCTGRTNITISFDYLEFGQGTNDDATLWYYDGTTWSQINSLAKTVCCGGNCNGNRQGQWTAFSMLLPASANNNSNIQIGFRWVNDDDGNGTDPSFAVDDVQLSVPASTLPQAIFSTSDSVFCAEPLHCINFTDHSIGTPTNWHWSFPGASPDTSAMQNPDSICYSSPGTYPVTLIVTNANGSDTLNVSPLITVGNAPAQPTITVKGGDTLISSHASYYQWFDNGSAITNATDSFYIATNSGSYSVQITDSIGCTSLSNFTVIGLSVNELKNETQIFIYPNPASGMLNLNFYNFQKKEDYHLYILNAIGEIVYSAKISSEKQSVSVADFANGLYLVRLQGAEQSVTTRVVVDKMGK